MFNIILFHKVFKLVTCKRASISDTIMSCTTNVVFQFLLLIYLPSVLGTHPSILSVHRWC